jgi:hypothetical protein
MDPPVKPEDDSIEFDFSPCALGAGFLREWVHLCFSRMFRPSRSPSDFPLSRGDKGVCFEEGFPTAGKNEKPENLNLIYCF